MKNTLLRLCAALLVAVALMGILSGCNTAEPHVTDPSGSIGSADHTGTDGTDSTTGAVDPAGTTGSDPAGNETISGTENIEPSTPPTTAPATQPTEPETEPTTQPTEPATEPTECSHSWLEWTTDSAATCEANGTKSRKCSRCGHTQTETIAATGHSWDDGTTSADLGIMTYTCKTCGKTKTEQIKGNHTFGSWSYEEYTYTQDGVSRVSHRKVRTCTKCGYKETDGTPDHYCARGSDDHVVTTVKEGTCSTKATMRSTCKICGWYVEYEGKKGSHTIKTETRHLTDYGAYTNELDVAISECTSCGATDVSYIYGEGFSDYNRYRNAVVISQGTAYASRTPGGADFLNHPTWQTVIRDYQYDSDGYVKQFTVYWHDASGNRYSQTINCTAEHLLSWFAEYGLTGGDGIKYQFKISGSQIVPWKVSWTG